MSRQVLMRWRKTEWLLVDMGPLRDCFPGAAGGGGAVLYRAGGLLPADEPPNEGWRTAEGSAPGPTLQAAAAEEDKDAAAPSAAPRPHMCEEAGGFFETASSNHPSSVKVGGDGKVTLTESETWAFTAQALKAGSGAFEFEFLKDERGDEVSVFGVVPEDILPQKVNTATVEEHRHRLTWTQRDLRWTCDICDETFSRGSSSFCCRKCDWDACPSCVGKSGGSGGSLPNRIQVHEAPKGGARLRCYNGSLADASTQARRPAARLALTPTLTLP